MVKVTMGGEDPADVQKRRDDWAAGAPQRAADQAARRMRPIGTDVDTVEKLRDEVEKLRRIVVGAGLAEE